MQINPPAQYLDKRGATRRISMGVRSIDYARAKGELPFYRVGRKVLFRVDDLDRFIEQHRVDVQALGG